MSGRVDGDEWAGGRGWAGGCGASLCASVDCRSDGPVCRRRDSDSVVMTQGRQC